MSLIDEVIIGKIYFFDIDGVLSVPLYENPDDKSLSCCMTNKQWEQESKNIDAYRNCKTLPCVHKFIDAINDDSTLCFVLSQEKIEECKKAKRKFINDHYNPEVFIDIIFVNKDEEKIDIIKNLANKLDVKLSDCYLVEDTLTTLIKAKENGINPIHITNVVYDY